jgi:thiol-disulfide isomerase/thioredoxin
MGSTTVMHTLRRSVVVLFPLALLTAACAGEGRPGGANAPPTQPALNATRAELLPTDAYALPGFDVDTYQRLLGQLEGTPVVVNIWASWCGPCRDEAPHLAAAASTYGDRVQFLGVDILDSRSSARGFMREFGWTYPSVFDADGVIRDELGFLGQPNTIFYDADGEVVFTWQGPIGPDLLTKQLDELAGPGSAA